ncbi:peptidase M61 domain protein [Thalassoporum mexicanum PCC 7367]|uniref:M61 family metallopeptidase n=1 Tax=Thalassoporum mexicanum TaxID=3457544 RepID=UPI00029FD463|nr:M61 family metallopeptidase [Pseudanabaena sp. PCC 7367]AFY71878.1 peptidase M61 domain protein [Pseudanabaena sp. PCC 7367]
MAADRIGSMDDRNQLQSPNQVTPLQPEFSHPDRPITQTSQPLLSYSVSMPQPQTHLLQLQLVVSNWDADYLDLQLPVWTPGSYLVREYAKHLQDFEAVDGSGGQLLWQKISKNHWRLETHGIDTIQVSYRIFGHDLTVRTNHIDGTHAYFNGAATFMYLPGHENQPIAVKINLPYDNWAIATALPEVAGQPNTFFAKDFDTLVDSPFEVGIHQRVEFNVLGKQHQFVVWGEGNPDLNQIIQDTAAVIEEEANIFGGGLPYDRYMFLLHLSASGYGGLEHKDCCSLNYPRFGFRKEKYLRFINLVAHEFFHTWNVKRLRPKELETFDYGQENYTPSLWFCEGVTSYYDQVIPLRAHIYDAKHFFKLIGDSITRFQTNPGRQVQSLRESSFDTWIKLYRPEPHTPNTQVSYYLKGELVAMLLDLMIRHKFQNQRSLDDVVQVMWEKFGRIEKGFSETELFAVIESVADQSIQYFLHQYLYSTSELDYNFYFEPFGLEVQHNSTQDYPPYLGINLDGANGGRLVKFVSANSPAHLAGISPGDELLAINGIRVSQDNLVDRLHDFKAGDEIELTLFRQDQLVDSRLVLDQPIADRYNLVHVPNPTNAQKHNLRSWLIG